MSPLYAYKNGSIVPWHEATVHAFSPTVRYAAGIFESICGFWNETSQDLYLFRLEKHIQRLQNSAKILNFANHTLTLKNDIIELIKANKLTEDVLIRPLIYLDEESPGGSICSSGESRLIITVYPRQYSDKIYKGCTAQISSWVKPRSDMMPAQVKSIANYHTARLAEMQSRHDGYDTAILLNDRGTVSEGPGQCVFAIHDTVLSTPDVDSDILDSVTRDTVIQIARKQGYTVVEKKLSKYDLYTADELFFCGSSWAITPIISVDNININSNFRITKQIQNLYFSIARNKNLKYSIWKTSVYD